MFFLLHCLINAILFINILLLCWPCTQESPPPNTSKDINLEEIQLPHFDCYTGKTLFLCNTTLLQNISTSEPQLQQPQRQKWQFISHGTSSENCNRVLIITRLMLKAPPQQKCGFFCTYKCAHAGI